MHVVIVTNARVRIADREGLRAFLLFQGLGGEPVYYEELLRKDQILTVKRANKTHFWVLHYKLRRSNFERYFENI